MYNDRYDKRFPKSEQASRNCDVKATRERVCKSQTYNKTLVAGGDGGKSELGSRRNIPAGERGNVVLLLEIVGSREWAE